MKCIQCLVELPINYNFCYNCGLEVKKEAPAPAPTEIETKRPFSPLGTLPSEVGRVKLEKEVADFTKEHGNLFQFIIDKADHVRIVSFENIGNRMTIRIPNFVYGFASLEEAGDQRVFKNPGDLEVIYLGAGLRDLSNMFVDANLTHLDLSDWDVSQIINMKQMFCSKTLKTVGDLKDWDVSHVLTMESMFAESALESIGEITFWDVSHVQDFSFLFSNSQLKECGTLSEWNVGRAKYMYGMFRGSKLQTIGDISDWDVSHVRDMGVMFGNSEMEHIGDISRWNVANVQSLAGMFHHAKMESVGDLFNWEVKNVKTMENMFARSQFNFCGDLSTWDMSAVKNLSGMFAGTDMTYLGEIANWDIPPEVPMENIFQKSTLFYTEKGLRDSFPSNQHHEDLQAIIDEYHRLYGLSLSFEIDEKAHIRISDFKNLNQVKELIIPEFVYGFSNSPFQNPGALESIALGKGLRDLSFMLQKCPMKHLDLTEWNVSKINKFNNMFFNSSIETVGDLSKWNTVQCFSMESMFHNSQITIIGNIEKWNTSHVKTMENMFFNSTLMEQMKLPSWYKEPEEK